QQRRRTLISFDIVMIAIAVVALMMGGIGMSSVMLSAVLERTGEIGIRRALGARKANIFRQFLTEAVAIALSAGIIAIIAGLMLARIIAATEGWASEMTFSAFLAALALSIGTGFVF